MTGNVVARRYATALFAVGSSQGDKDQETYGAQLSELAKVLDGSPEALDFFSNPSFSKEEKKAVLKKIVESMSLDKMVVNFCELLADKGRADIIAAVAFDYSNMLDAKMGVISGELVTVNELSSGRQAAIKTRLEEQAGKKLELTFAADKEILGGVVLKVGDKVLDASLRAQLQILKENIKRGE